MLAPLSDSELIGQCKRGKLKAQELLYKRFYSFAMGVAIRYVINRDDGLEVVNDSFIKLFRSFDSYDEHQPLKPWLRRIVINTALDSRRRQKHFQFSVELGEVEGLQSPVTVIDQLNANDILNLLEQLTPLQRSVFNLYEIDGYNHEEIAEMLGVTASTSRSYLTRAKEKLRTALVKQDNRYAKIS